MLHQVGEELIRLGFEWDGHPRTAQLTAVGIKDILTKDVQHSHAFPGVKAINSLLMVVPLAPSGEYVEEGLGLLEVDGVKTFGEPVIDRGEQHAGLSALALVLPQPCEADCR